MDDDSLPGSEESDRSRKIHPDGLHGDEDPSYAAAVGPSSLIARARSEKPGDKLLREGYSKDSFSDIKLSKGLYSNSKESSLVMSQPDVPAVHLPGGEVTLRQDTAEDNHRTSMDPQIAFPVT